MYNILLGEIIYSIMVMNTGWRGPLDIFAEAPRDSRIATAYGYQLFPDFSIYLAWMCV